MKSQKKIVYICFAVLLVVAVTSSAVAGRYPESTSYVIAGVVTFAVALVFVAAFMARSLNN